MRMYLMSKGLWGAVADKGTTTVTKEQQAHAAIVLNLKDSQLMHVIDSATAREAWGRLAKFTTRKTWRVDSGLRKSLHRSSTPPLSLRIT